MEREVNVTTYNQGLGLHHGLDGGGKTGYGVVRDPADGGKFVPGISGVKYPASEWVGYENTTVSVASDILNRINTQNGIQPTDPAVLAAREPFRVGRFLVKWFKAPPFFPDIACKYLRYIFEDMVREVSGINENSIDPFEVTNGTVRQSTSYPGIYKESNNKLSLKVYETQGSLVRKFIDYWISGISDRKTGVCHMYGAKMRAILPNLAGSFMYVLLGPSCRPEDIEFSCMLLECFPGNEKVSHVNSSSIGEAGNGQELEIEFNGIYERGPEVDIIARKVVEGYNLYGQSFLNQLLPSYMYDTAMYTDEKWKETNSIDINDRIKAIKNDGKAQKIYTDVMLSNRLIGRGSGTGVEGDVPNFDYRTSKFTLQDMGEIVGGYAVGIDHENITATNPADINNNPKAVKD